MYPYFKPWSCNGRSIQRELTIDKNLDGTNLENNVDLAHDIKELRFKYALM